MSTWLPQLFSLLTSINGEPPKLTFSQVTTFSLIIICLKEMIHWHRSWTTTDPPLTLPLNVITFCSDSLSTEHEIINWLWIYVWEVVWHDGASDRDEELLRNKSLLSLFLKYGARHQIGACNIMLSYEDIRLTTVRLGFYDIYLPLRTCLDANCSIVVHNAIEPRELSKIESVQVTLFTRDYGALPLWSFSASCRGKLSLVVNISVSDREHRL